MVKYLKGGRLGFWVKYQLFLDVIWLDNLIVNFIVLYITWKLSGNTGSLLRLWCSAGIGAFYAVLLILPGFSFLSWLPFKILLSLIMLLAGFRLGWKEEGFSEAGLKFLKILGYFYGTTFVLGGAAFGLYYFLGIGFQVTNGVFLIKDFPVKIIFISIVLLILLYRWLWPLLQLQINHNKLVYPVEVRFGDDVLVVDAFLDTGNALTDPASGRPVIVVEFTSIKPILPSDIQGIYISGKEQQVDYIIKIMAESEWISRFHIVPYNTLSSGSVGSSEDFLLAFRPDQVRIKKGAAWKEARQSLVGIRNRRLSSAGEYHALIQPHIIP